ncbi:MAG: invasion associated locus b family protein [Methylobacterium sp.]|uniref:invasion associated locus b family protein n=1 Tax=Methylobacterium sp. TaxID=409 RepID=UPI0025E530B6|nr:invasion associated locus b family protein [Methylobacterium sp.]MBX9934302.1 invasion associated locus b family protein [Methylobacterium sp.]
MSRVLRRSLPFGVSALILSCPIPQGLPLDLVGSRPVQAQAQAAPAAEETEQPRRRGRRGRDSANDAAKSSSKAAPGTQQAKPVVTIGDWNVFASGQGRDRVCYAIAQPQSRSLKSLKRDTAYLFVTVRKGENIQNEVAVMLGFPARESASQAKPPSSQAATPPGPSDPILMLGNVRYALVVKKENAWLQNPAEEPRVVTEMGRTQKLLVKATSTRGNGNSDEYALAGFAEAMKRTREECR